MKAKLKQSISFSFALILSILLIFAFFAPKEKAKGEETRILRVWNVDTFDGGKGSRTSFLKKAARSCEKKREGVYYLVLSYTLEGALAAFEKGDYPDAISFGVGLEHLVQRAVELPFFFAGGSIDGKCYAYPWCKGFYALFSLTDHFDEEGKVAISSGGNNLSAVSAALEGIEGEYLDGISAYTGFLSGSYRYLLGTQRDFCRFQTRGVSVFYKILPAFCDLYQYFSILTPSKKEDLLFLLNELLASSVDSIGMLPPLKEQPRNTVSVFSSLEALKEIGILAREKDAQKKLENFLKTV